MNGVNVSFFQPKKSEQKKDWELKHTLIAVGIAMLFLSIFIMKK